MAILALSSCSSDADKMVSGPVIVTGTEYDDADTWLQPMPCGKSTCLIPMSDSEHWLVSIKQCPPTVTKKSTEDPCLEDTLEVDEGTFDSLTAGNPASVTRTKDGDLELNALG